MGSIEPIKPMLMAPLLYSAVELALLTRAAHRKRFISIYSISKHGDKWHTLLPFYLPVVALPIKRAYVKAIHRVLLFLLLESSVIDSVLLLCLTSQFCNQRSILQ